MSETGIFVWSIFVLVYSQFSLFNSHDTSLLWAHILKSHVGASIWFG